jgi:hypothetical protein
MFQGFGLRSLFQDIDPVRTAVYDDGTSCEKDLLIRSARPAEPIYIIPPVEVTRFTTGCTMYALDRGIVGAGRIHHMTSSK